MYTIYKISNTINDKIYIGQIRQSLKARMNGHKQAHTLIGMAIRKYGIQNFSIECIDTAENNEQALFKEKHYINEFSCCYPNGYNGIPNNMFDIKTNKMYVTFSKFIISNETIMEGVFLKYATRLLQYIRWDFFIVDKNNKILQRWTDLYELLKIKDNNFKPKFRKFCKEYGLILSDEHGNKYVDSKYFVLCEDNDI